MHELYAGDPAITEFDVHYMSDPARAERTRSILICRDPSIAEKQLPWGIIPDRVDPSRGLKLIVDHDDPSVVDLPEVVRQLPDLLWLEIPSRFVKKISNESIPPSTRTLRITGGGTANLPRSLELPGLERLEVLNNGTLKFRAGQIPDARHLGLKLDPAGAVLREIERVEKLVALEVGPVRGVEILEQLVDRPLLFFKLVHGDLDSIEPLRRCPSLTNLWLLGLRKLTSIAPLEALPDLRELSISYCTRLRVDRTLLTLPSLRKLLLFANRDIGLASIAGEIEGLGLESFIGSDTL